MKLIGLEEHFVTADTVIGACQPRHRSAEFRAFLDTIKASVPAGLQVHLILDNATTHKTELMRRVQRHGRAGKSHPRLHPGEQCPAQALRVWAKTADTILASVNRFCQRTSNSDHC